MKLNFANQIIRSICNSDKVSGYSHDFYKYPARFPPSFARKTIEIFTKKGDLVFDPFMGGGTTLVEANAIGRRAIGSDISSLATFVSRVKTYWFSEQELEEISSWLYSIQPKLNLHRDVDRPLKWIDKGYQKNLNAKDTWPTRKIVELMLNEISHLSNRKYQDFSRCLLLRTAQWAIDSRRNLPSANEFRAQLFKYFSEFSKGALDFSDAVTQNKNFFKDYEQNRIQCLNLSSDKINSFVNESPKLVLTSPPYPGVHVLYHRWQVHGRKETPAPFWIAGCQDGHGESFYTMGGRSDYGISNYFDIIEESFKAIYELSDRNTIIVQVVGFSNPDIQFSRYLDILVSLGFREKKLLELSNSNDGRLWRNVPNRKWYTVNDSPGCQEVVLFHKR